MRAVLLLVALAAVANALRFIPICDPLIDGYEKGSCHKVSVIYDPHFPGDMDHCVCHYIIKTNGSELGIEGPLYLSKLRTCAFAEENDATSAWLKNDCTEKVPSPSVEIKGIHPTTKYAFNYHVQKGVCDYGTACDV
jgi:hypothetical protein